MQNVMELRLDALFAMAKFAARKNNDRIADQALAVYQGAGSVMGGKAGGESMNKFMAQLRSSGGNGAAQTGWGDDGDKLAAVGKKMARRLK